MMSAPLPQDEAERIALLRETEVLDTPEEPSFDALAAGAAELVGCSMALVSLVDSERQWFKAHRGLDLRQTPRRVSFCAHAVASDAVLEVEDAQTDERFADNPLVTGGPRIRFYAGFPLRLGGRTLGTLCVLDPAPRRLTAEQRERLLKLADAVAELLGLRLQTVSVERERARLYDFARASGEWMWETDADLRYTWISATYEMLTGVPVREWLGRRIVDTPLLDARTEPLVPPQTLHGLLARREPFSRALTEQRIGGRRLYVSRSAVPVFDEQGRHAGWRGTARDMTARLALSARARDTEQLLSKLAANVPGIIFQYRRHSDGRGSYPYVSPRAREIYAVDPPPPEVTFDDEVLLTFVHPQDREAYRASIAEAASRFEPWVHDYRIVRGDGGVRWLESRATPERLADGGSLWHGFSADVSDRKAIELALRRSEQQWEMAAEATGTGLATLDLRRDTLQLDRRASIVAGLPHPHPPLTVGDWKRAILRDDRERVVQTLERSLAAQKLFETRYRMRRPDGQVRLVEIVARGTYDAQGRPSGAVGTCRDVTEQAASEQLRREKESAERAARAKTQFLSRVSHELRTPLNSILGFAQMMALDRVAPLPEVQRQRLLHVQQAGHHLLGLINDVLELSRAEQPEQAVLDCRPLDVAQAVADCLATLAPQAEAHRVRLGPAPASSAASWACADARALGQVLVNLVVNAIKYNRPEGLVAVTLERPPGEGGERLAVRVRDEGPGLTRKQQSHLFEPFNRLGAERRRIEGTGLGLVIARELARAMGGSIEVESHVGEGSTFTLLLPACERPDAPLVAGASPAPAGEELSAAPARRQLLYIEDEALNVLLVQEVVGIRPEWSLEVAGDGASGFERCVSLQPALVLIDMNLPDTNGLELIRRLRADARTAGLRCVALSADAMQEQIEAAREAGFDAYWTKPIDVKRLLADLSSALDAPA